MSLDPLARLAVVIALLVSAAAQAAGFALTLNVELDPAARRLDAVAEIVAPGDFTFTLHESLTVRTASVGGRAVPFSAGKHTGGERTWRVAAARGALLRIAYGGMLPALDRTADHRRVLQRTPPGASADGSYLPAGSGWYPDLGHPFSYRVRLSLPPDQRGLVAGRLAAEHIPSKPGERYVAELEFAEPSEGIDLMAGPYVVREQLVPRERGEPLRLRTYFYRDIDALAESYLADTARYIALYSEQIGAYPYSGFSIVASPLPTGFGMATLTYIGAQVLKLPFIRATSLGHEVLHNWWGNGVYVDYARGNWSEGLTTFMADYFYKERESADAAREMRLAWLRDFAAVPPGAHLPLSAFRSRTHGAEAAVGYGKSAMMFFMLRDLIGEDAFRRGIRIFWEKNRFKVARWDDLRSAFEQASGRSLAPFFEQWVRRAGGPGIDVSEARARTTSGRNTLMVTFTQDVPVYALEVAIEIVMPHGSEVRRVTLERERQTVTLETTAPAEGVRVDPDLRLWRVLDPRELPPILRQWILSRAARFAVVSGEADVRAAAATLAESFFESRPQAVDAGALGGIREPVLLVGLQRDVDAALARLALPPRPAAVAGRGSAQIWTIAATAATPPIAAVSARDAESIGALARPLPHYGAQSYIVFDGAQAMARGVWPAAAPVVRVNHER